MISSDYHWAKEAKGSIAFPPLIVLQNTGDWQDVRRRVKSVRGIKTFYWVYFETEQFDTECDRPYIGAEIDAAFLRPDPGASCLIAMSQKENLGAVWYENRNLGLKVEFKVFLESDGAKKIVN